MQQCLQPHVRIHSTAVCTTFVCAILSIMPVTMIMPKLLRQAVRLLCTHAYMCMARIFNMRCSGGQDGLTSTPLVFGVCVPCACDVYNCAMYTTCWIEVLASSATALLTSLQQRSILRRRLILRIVGNPLQTILRRQSFVGNPPSAILRRHSSVYSLAHVASSA